MATVDWDLLLDAELGSTPSQPPLVTAGRQTDGVDWDVVLDAELEKEPRSWAGWAADAALQSYRDTGVVMAKGAVGVPQAITGLADMIPLTAALPGAGGPLATRAAEAAGIPLYGWSGWMQEKLGIRYEDAQTMLHEAYSPETQAAYQEVAEAEGILGKVDAALRNPSMILTTVGEAIPQMFVGGAIGKGLKAAGIVSKARHGAAIGEGLISAGSGAEQTRAQSPDGLLTEEQVAIHTASGAVTATIGVLGAKVASRLGVDDLDVLLAGGAGQQEKRNVLIRVLAGALIEGGVEEAPQSVQEQIASNLATGKPWHEGWDQALVVGALSGAVMGGGIQLRPRGAARMTAEELTALRSFDHPPSGKEWKESRLPMERRKGRPRLPNAEKRAEAWQQAQAEKEVSDAEGIRGAEEEVREREGREDLRGRREKQISPQPPSEVTEAPKVAEVLPSAETTPEKATAPPPQVPTTPAEPAVSEPPTVAPQPEGRPGVKQPWQMTREEYVSQQPRRLQEAVGNSHRRDVARALAEGKPVPPEVLADYPDLAPQAPQAPSAAETPTEPPKAPETPGEATGERETGAEAAFRAVTGEDYANRHGEAFGRYFREFDTLDEDAKNREYRANERRGVSFQSELGAKVTHAGSRVGLTEDGMRNLLRAIQEPQPVSEAPEAAPAEPETGAEAPQAPTTPPEAPPPQHPEEQAETAPPSGIELTSIKKAIVNELRELVGLPEMEGSTRQSVEQWANIAETTLAADPRAAERLVNELATTPRAITQHDAMLLQFRYRQLANELEPVVEEYFDAVNSKDPVAIAAARTAVLDARKKMTDFEEIIHPSKETWGRTGVALQQMLRRDFSREAILRRGREANHGEPLSNEQKAELDAMAQNLEDLQDQFDAKSRKVEELERERASQKQHEEVVKDAAPKQGRKKSASRKAAEKKVADAWAEFNMAISARAGFAVPVDLLPPAIKVAKAYAELGIVRFREFMAHVRKKQGADADEELFRKAWDRVQAEGDVVEPEVDMGDLAALSKEARRIQRTLIEAGMTNRDEVIDAVHEAMQEFLPDFTRRQTMDALSQYGQFQTQSQEELDKLIRDMNAEVLKLSQMDQMEIALKRVEELRAEGLNDEEIGNRLAQENLLVEATGLVRDKPTETVRQLTKQYNELKKSIPATSEGQAGRLQTAQDAIVRGLRNRIKDVQWEIKHQERIVRERKVTPDNELIRALRAELDELMTIHLEVLPPQRKQMTPEQKLAAAERGAKRMLDFMRKQEEAGFPPAPAKETPLSSAELKATRKKIAEIRKRRDAAQREGKRVAHLDQQIAKLKERLQTGDIAPKARPTPYTTPMIEARIARRRQLQAEMEARQKAEMPELAAARARKAYEASLRKRIADYRQTLADGDFAPKPKKEPRKLSPSELNLKREMEDVRHQVLQKFAEYHLAHLTGIAWTGDKIAEAAHLSRAMMTSFDLSALLRQGGLPAMGHPIMAKRALFETVASIAHTFDTSKAMALREGVTKENVKRFLKTIDSRQADFNFMHKLSQGEEGEFRLQAGLSLPSTDEAITRQEEVFQGRWGKLVPGVAVSSRLYTMILNKMRVDLFDLMVQNLGRNGQVTMEEAKLIANFVNVATGRSDFKQFNNWAAVLNIAFFAPRYVASRFQYLTMPFYLPFKGGVKANWRVKRAIYKEYGRTATGISTVLGAAALAGLLFYDDDDDDRPQVETNPLSSDFLKVRLGETRLDFLAGLSQVFVFQSRWAAGRSKGSVSGKITKFGEGYKPQTRATVTGRFLRSKMAPVLGAAWTIAADWTNVVGGKETPFWLGLGLVTPLSVHDVVETMRAQGIPKTMALSLLAILGVGMNTYGPKTDYLTAKPAKQKELLDKYIENMTWEDGLPAYNESLTEKDVKRVYDQQDKVRQNVAYGASGAKPTKREDYESDKSYQTALSKYDKAQERFQEFRPVYAPTYEDAKQLLKEYWRRPRWNKDSKKKKKGSIYLKDTNTLNPFYETRLARLEKLYSQD